LASAAETAEVAGLGDDGDRRDEGEAAQHLEGCDNRQQRALLGALGERRLEAAQPVLASAHCTQVVLEGQSLGGKLELDLVQPLVVGPAPRGEPAGARDGVPKQELVQPLTSSEQVHLGVFAGAY
jgi:hypothetical protein